MEQESNRNTKDFPTTMELSTRLAEGDEVALVSAREYYRKVVSVLTDIQHTVNDSEPPPNSRWYEHFMALTATKQELETLLQRYDPGYLE